MCCRLRTWSLVALLALAAIGAAAPAQAETFALLVAVSSYPEGSFLPKLRYPDRDIDELAATLRRCGCGDANMRVLTAAHGTRDARFLPIASNIRRELSALTKLCGDGDTLIVAFAGHGVLMKVAADGRRPAREVSFFCPLDADLAEKDLHTLVSLEDAYDQLERCPARVKLLLSDACRNVPEGGRLTGVELNMAVPPPKTVAALFACAKNQVALEDPQLGGGHGIFFHFVIEGLRGAADADSDKTVTLTELATYAQDRVAKHASAQFGKAQTPELFGQTHRIALAKVARPPTWQLVVKRLVVKPAKFNGQAWDFLGNAPDPELRIVNATRGVSFLGPKAQDQADVTYNEAAFAVQAGDRLDFTATDIDIMEHDPIGAHTLTLQDLQLQRGKLTLQFGQVQSLELEFRPLP